MTHSVDTRYPLSPASPAKWLLLQGGGHIWIQYGRLPLTNDDLVIGAQRPTLSPQYGTILWGEQPAIWWQVKDTALLPSWNGQHFVPTERDTYSEYGFAFPACNASAKTTTRGLTECLIHH